ncbi:MAG: type II secretion system F family protein [Lachnospiraceae bacterium]|nr:type II secretion system F family protein [Lachnospiraceae bacterium]
MRKTVRKNVREQYEKEKRDVSGMRRNGKKMCQRQDNAEGGKTEGGKPDYHSWQFSLAEKAAALVSFLAFDLAIAWLFYNHPAAAAAGLPLFIPWIRYLKRKKAADRRRMLCFDFRDALNSLTVSLRAGRSVEYAFIEAAEDLKLIKGEQTPMVRELAWIAKQLRLSVPIEELLLDLAGRSGEEEIENFAAVFAAAKRAGGDLPGMIRRAAETIEGRIDVEREIEMLLSAKRMEQAIMSVMPAGIILYMRVASPGFLDVLYGSAAGTLIMSVCLAVYAGAVRWGMKIVKIEV